MTQNVCTGFRLAYGRGLASGCDARIGETHRPTLVGLAMALDEAVDAAAEGEGNHGNRGFGGVWVEACFSGDPDDADTPAERIEDLSQVDAICGPLPFGDRALARQFRVAQNYSSVWDGHNHIGCSTAHVDRLLAMSRQRRANCGAQNLP